MLKNRHPSLDIDEQETNIKAVEKALGEPFGLEFSEPIRKMRTHLLICVVVSLAATLMDLRIKHDTPVFGVQFEGLTDGKIFIGLLAINSYLLMHFFWCSLDAFQEWRLRRTGTMVAYVTTTVKLAWPNESLDFSDDPKQSTLYRWWSQSTTRIISVPNAIHQIELKIATMMDAVIVELNKAQTPALAKWQTEFMAVRQQLVDVTNSLTDTTKVLSDDRIPASLRRFDNAFSVLLKSQNARWLFLEWLLPLALGLAATAQLLSRI